LASRGVSGGFVIEVAAHAIWEFLERPQGTDHRAVQLIGGLNHLSTQRVVLQIVPDAFVRIQFGSVGGKKNRRNRCCISSVLSQLLTNAPTFDMAMCYLKMQRFIHIPDPYSLEYRMRYLWRAIKLLLPLKGLLVLYVGCTILLASVSSVPFGVGNVLLHHLRLAEQDPAAATVESGAAAGMEDTALHQGASATTKLKSGQDAVSKWINAQLVTWFGAGTSLLYALCLIILACLVVKGVLDFLVSYLQGYIATKLQMDATVRVMRHALTLDMDFFDNEKMGDLAVRVYGDTGTLRATAKVTLDMLEKPPHILFLIGIAAWLNWQLFLIGALGIPLMVVPFYTLTRKLYKNTYKAIDTQIDISQAGGQMLGGLRLVRAYHATEAEGRNFARLIYKYMGYSMRKIVLRAIQRPLTEVILGLGAILVLMVGSGQVMRGETSLENFMVFLAALMALSHPVKGLLSTLSDITEFVPSAERTFELLDRKPKIVEKLNAVELQPLQREIVFENVTLDYGRGPIFEGLHLSIRKGERLGIVGRTGVGKSSLLWLLLRFYEPKVGRVLIDGVDIREATFQSLRGHMAVVAQDTFLFHTTIAENIRYGRPGASQEDLVTAAQAAAIHDEIMSFPEGYQTVTGHGGAALSGGQRQRLSVARAILRAAPVLLLDEATSAMDTEREAHVQAALDKLACGRTSIVIAHRLSTIRGCDRIVVFADTGGIEKIGTHAELLATSPTYKRLWDRLAGRKDATIDDAAAD